MGKDRFEAVKETLQIYGEDEIKDKELTRDLLVGDYLTSLGYDRRRNRGIKNVLMDNQYWNNLDFTINNDSSDESSCDLGIRYLPYNAEIHKEEVKTFLEACESVRARLGIITNIKDSYVYDLGELANCGPILHFNLDNYNEDAVALICRDTFNYSNIIARYKKSTVSTDEILDYLDKSKEDIAIDILLKCDKVQDSGIAEKVSELLHGVIGQLRNVEVAEDNSKYKGMYEEAIVALDNEKKAHEYLREQIEPFEQLKQQMIKLKTENENLINEHQDWLYEKDMMEQTKQEWETERQELLKENTRLQRVCDDTEAIRAGYVTEVNGCPIQRGIYLKLSECGEKLAEEVRNEYTSVVYYARGSEGKLIRSKELSKFIGLCINDLFLTHNARVSAELYSSGLFTFVNPCTNTDFIINGKQHQLNLSNMTNVEAINNLREFARRLHDREFDCTVSNGYQPIKSDAELDEDIREAIAEQNFEDSRNKMYDSMLGEDSTVTLKVPLKEVSTILKSGDIEVLDIKHIANSESLYNIPEYDSKDEKSSCRIISKSIDALISLSADMDTAIANLKNNRLVSKVNCIEIAIKNVEGYPKVPFAPYIIEPAKNLDEALIAIQDLAEIMGVDMEDTVVFIGSRVSRESSEILQYAFDERYIETGDFSTFDDMIQRYTKPDAERINVLVSGDLLNSVTLSKSGLEFQNKLIVGLRRFSEFPELDLNTDEGKKELYNRILEKALHTLKNVEKLGKVVGTDYCFMSEDIEKVGVDNVAFGIDLNGSVYYVYNCKPYELAYAILKIGGLFYGARESLEIEIDKETYLSFSPKQISSDPTYNVAVKTLLGYINKKIKEQTEKLESN